MDSLKRPRVLWFLCLAVLVVVNTFFGDLFGEHARNTGFIALIFTAAISFIVLLAIDRRGPDRRSLSEHANDVQRAMEAEEDDQR